jgi:cobalt-zinc-cadmium efflux system outer membrane protein
MLRFLFLLSFTLITAAPRVSAGTLTLRLDQVPDRALTRNPQLQAARLRVEEARGRLLGAGRLTNPELNFDSAQNLLSPERSLGMEFVQRFPVTARLKLEKAVSKALLAAAEAEVRDAGRKLAAEAGALGVQLVALSAQEALRREQLATSRRQAEFVANRVALGEASALDAAQLELESRQIELELLQITARRGVWLGTLRPLLGIEPGRALEITGGFPAPAPAPTLGSANRADLEAARQMEKAAQQSLGLAKARRWNDIGVGVSASGQRVKDIPAGFLRDYFLGFSLSLPLPLWNRNEGAIAEAAAAAQRAAKEADALALQVRSETATARAEMEALARVVSEMDTALLPKAVQVEAMFQAAHDAGQGPLLEVRRARTRRLELALRRVDALRDYHLARVRYEAAQGNPIRP